MPCSTKFDASTAFEIGLEPISAKVSATRPADGAMVTPRSTRAVKRPHNSGASIATGNGRAAGTAAGSAVSNGISGKS